MSVNELSETLPLSFVTNTASIQNILLQMT